MISLNFIGCVAEDEALLPEKNYNLSLYWRILCLIVLGTLVVNWCSFSNLANGGHPGLSVQVENDSEITTVLRVHTTKQPSLKMFLCLALPASTNPSTVIFT